MRQKITKKGFDIHRKPHWIVEIAKKKKTESAPEKLQNSGKSLL